MKILLAMLAIFASSFVVSAQVVPILDLKANGLLGGVKDGKFVTAEAAFKELEKNQKYGIYSLEIGRLPDDLQLTIDAPDGRGPCEDFYSVSDEPENSSGIAVGTNANWDILPNALRKMSLTDKTYLNIVSGILKSKGLPLGKARIEQAFRVDLEGDGVDEVVLTASSYKGNIQPSAKAGDYSFVLVRKIVAGKVRNIVLAEEYVKKNIKFGAPSHWEVSAIADLNGDQQMEIILYSEYYEGSGAAGYQIKAGKAVAIKELQTFCGV